MVNNDTEEAKQHDIMSKFLFQPAGRTMVPLKEIRPQRRESGIRQTLINLLKPVVSVGTRKCITSMEPELGKASRSNVCALFAICFVFSEMTSRLCLSS